MTEESRPFRFGEFELDAAQYQLRRRGRLVRLERRPMDLLILLVSHPSELVSREAIAAALWGNDVFVDFDNGVNTAIRKVRQALHDSAEKPAFIETVLGKGYRFIGRIEAPLDMAAPADSQFNDPGSRPFAPAVIRDKKYPGLSKGLVPPHVVVVAAAAALMLAAVGFWKHFQPGSAPIRIAVLPFESLSGDPDRQYIADGLTEETIATLSQVDPARLNVIARTTVTAYSRTSKPLSVIAQELGVDYLIESAVRSDDSRVRLTSRLIRARDQAQIWSRSYERGLPGVLDLQKDLSAAIAEEVHVRLTSARAEMLARRHTTKPEAYESFLRGRFYERQRTPAANAAAIQHFRYAIDADPAYALAWAGMADVIASSAINGDAAPAVVALRAREAAQHARDVGSDLSETITASARVHFWFDWDWRAAEGDLRAALRTDSANAEAHRMLGVVYSHTQRHEDAEREFSRAADLDPLNPIQHAVASEGAFRRRDYSAALAHARRALTIDSHFWIGHMTMAQAYEQSGHYELALEALANAELESGGNSKPLSLRGYVLARAGRRDDARAVIKTLEARARDAFVPPYAFALIYAGLGEMQTAFEWLDRARVVGDVHLVFLTVDPKWDEYRSDDRFKALLASCRFTSGKL